MGCAAYKLQAGSGAGPFASVRISGCLLVPRSYRFVLWRTGLELLLTFANDGTFDGTFFSKCHFSPKLPMRSPSV